MASSKRILELISTLAVAILAICAVALTAGNIQRTFFPAAYQVTQAADSVTDWRMYAVAGNREGPANAVVTVVVFFDYQCPVCRADLGRIEDLRKLHPEDVSIVWRDFPLEGHRFAMPAARASVCAGRAGRFQAMHYLLFSKQDSLGQLPWSELARRAGIRDSTGFSACLTARSTQSTIDSDLAAAQSIHALGTPTLLVNELEYEGAPQDLKQIVRYVLRHAT